MHALWWVLGFLLALPPVVVAQRHDIPQEDIGLKIATHYGAGDCSGATLNAAICSLGSTVTTLVIPPVARNSITPCVWNVAANVTFPSTMRISIPRGVVLRPASGVTICSSTRPM